jgi:hypothetical protein
MNAPFTKTNLVLAALCATQLVVLLIVGASEQPAPARSAADAAVAGKKPFAGLAVEAVASIECKKREAAAIRLEKSTRKEGDQEKTTWTLADRDGAPAQASKAEEILATLKKISLTRVVTRQPKRYAGLNVADEATDLHVVVKAADGRVLADVRLGETRDYSSLHARFAGDDAVYATTGAGLYDFAAEAQSTAETEFLKLDPTKIARIRVKHDGAEFEAVKETPASRPATPESRPESGPASQPAAPPAPFWITKGPTPEKLDSAKMETWLRGVAQLALSEPIGKERKPEYGFEKPTATLVLVLDDGRETEVKIGAERKDQYDWYAVASGNDRVVTVKSYNVTDWFKKTVKDLLPTTGAPSDG